MTTHPARFVAVLLSLLFVLSIPVMAESFKTQQSKYPRVRAAREEKADLIDSLFKAANIDYPPGQIFMRAFKRERQLELWVKDSTMENFQLLRIYDFTAYSGDLGPKRYQGDMQIPEGFYYIDRFNPASKFHMSLGINYPNKSDRIRKTKDDPGGDIFIHGNRVTIGCIPLGDDRIKELYIIAVDTKSNGQDKIPVHIFPFRLDEPVNKKVYIDYAAKNLRLLGFWEELRPAYDYFQENRKLSGISIDKNGRYEIEK